MLCLAEHEIEGIRMLVSYQQHLLKNRLFPEDITTFRVNSISFKDYETFATANGFHINAMKKDKYDSASSSVKCKEPSDHKEPTLKTLFRSTLPSGSKLNNEILKSEFKNDNNFDDEVVTADSTSPEPTHEDLPHDSMPSKSTAFS